MLNHIIIWSIKDLESFYIYNTLHMIIKHQFTLGDGITLYVLIILSGYSSLIFARIKVPMPLPVPPPSE
jgi:hypothetical protein